MGSNQSSSSKAILNDANNLYETSSSACIGTCTTITTNQTIIISNTTVGGNIDITNQCSASASCVMQSIISSQVQNVMSSMASQENITTQLLPIAFDFNNKNTSTTIQQNITNNMTQTLQAVCQATDTTLTTNQTLIGSNDTFGGNVSIMNQGSANANCTINNLSRMTLFNQSTSSDDQTTKQSTVLGVMMISIVIILVIGAIILVIVIGPAGLAAVVGFEHSGSKTTDTESNGSKGSALSLLLGEGEGESGSEGSALSSLLGEGEGESG
jgi:hypothetical protein